jgi:hypothetical protein
LFLTVHDDGEDLGAYTPQDPLARLLDHDVVGLSETDLEFITPNCREAEH